MYRLLIISALVAYAYGGMRCCSMEDRKTVLRDWQSVWSAEHIGRRILLAKRIFEEMFAKVPETKNLFKRVNVDNMDSPMFSAHCIRVINGFDLIINDATDSDILHEALLHLGEQHAKIDGLKASYLEVFRHAAADILGQAVPCFNSAAWERCISAMQTIQAAALPN